MGDNELYDAVVVGAGPSGAAAAFHLARRGRRVLLLERRRFPRDKVCGDGLTRAALRRLDTMGLLPRLGAAHEVDGVRIVMRGHAPRDLRYPQNGRLAEAGIVMRRIDLDELLVRRAVEAGAELVEGVTVRGLARAGDDAVSGVQATADGTALVVRARVVVAADGATSRLARLSGLAADEPARMGYAVRGYVEGITGLDDLLEIHIPLTDLTDRHVLPSYGWVFPLGEGSANVGVGLFERTDRANVADLGTQFLRALRAKDPRFRASTTGRWQGAPLRFDFSPDRCAAPGLLLVGDAAGMVSPFTGEGISYALESGELAAQCIDEELTRSPGAVVTGAEYGRRLGMRHTGYFETGRASARRYRMVWHVLDATFDDDRPAFDLVRRAALFPEGIGDSYLGTLLDDVGPVVEEQAPRLRGDLLAVAEVVTDTVRSEWPFLARLSTVDDGVAAPAFRPALLLLLASYVGRPGRSLSVLAASAVELGYLAGMALGGMVEETSGEPRANWGNGFAVLASDFLLSCAHRLAARAGDVVAAVVADALGQATRGRLRELRHAGSVDVPSAEHMTVIDDKIASLFTLPCRLGGMLAGLPAPEVTALADYGRRLGRAYALTDELLECTAGTPWTRWAIGGHAAEGVLGLPALLAARSDPDGPWRQLARDLASGTARPERVRDALRGHPALAEVADLAVQEAEAARAALGVIPDHPARACLQRLADHVRARAAAAADGA